MLPNPHSLQYTLKQEENKIRSKSLDLALESVTSSGKIRRTGIINMSPVRALPLAYYPLGPALNSSRPQFLPLKGVKAGFARSLLTS